MIANEWRSLIHFPFFANVCLWKIPTLRSPPWCQEKKGVSMPILRRCWSSAARFMCQLPRLLSKEWRWNHPKIHNIIEQNSIIPTPLFSTVRCYAKWWQHLLRRPYASSLEAGINMWREKKAKMLQPMNLKAICHRGWNDCQTSVNFAGQIPYVVFTRLVIRAASGIWNPPLSKLRRHKASCIPFENQS